MKISVVVPCHESVGYLPRCLASLAAQTIERDDFEVVLVFNGPDDGGQELASSLLAGHKLQHQSILCSPGASNARNKGIAAARGQWVTLLDVDDEFSDGYLEAMLDAATSPGIVPVSGMESVSPQGLVSPWHANAELERATQPTSPSEFYPHLSVNAGKLIPTEIMKRHPFDVSLRSGEDVALYSDLFEAEGLLMTSRPARSGATYRRHVTPSSVSRQDPGLDFMVNQRLAVIRKLTDQMRHEGNSLDRIRRVFISSQASFIQRYLCQHPNEAPVVQPQLGADEYPVMLAPLRPSPPRQALISETWAPDASPAVDELLRWLTGSGRSWQIVSTTAVTATDKLLPSLASLVTYRHDRIPLSPVAWHHPVEFCTAALSSLRDFAGTTGLDLCVSVGNWPLTHLAAAIYSAQTGTKWQAKVSGPLRAVHGELPDHLWPWATPPHGDIAAAVITLITHGADSVSWA